MLRIIVVFSPLYRFWLTAEERCQQSYRHGRHICGTTVCCHPCIIATLRNDFTSLLFLHLIAVVVGVV